MNLAQIAALSLGTLVAEGFVLARIPGADPFFGVTRTAGSAALGGVSVTVAMTLAAMATWPVGRLLTSPSLYHLQILFFVAIIAAISALFALLLKKMPPRISAALGIYPHSIALNSAVLGVAMLNSLSGAGFFAAVSGAMTAGVGFFAVSVLFATVRERVTLTANCPKAMEGLPIALVTAGLLALAFSGFGGVRAIGG